MCSIVRALLCAGVGLAGIVFMSACGHANSFEPDSHQPAAREPFACNTAVEVECTNVEELALDAVSGLGFSANDVLPMIVGNYEIPIRWVSPCHEGTACPAFSDCSQVAEQPPVSVAGTKTTLSLGLTAVGPAEVRAPGPGQDACGQSMAIAGVLSIQTEDGAVDMERDVVIWTECGNEITVGLVGSATQLGGTLGAELGDNVGSNLSFGASHEHRVWFTLSFVRLVEGGPRPVTLWGEMLVGDLLCYQTVPRKDVLLGAE